MNSRVRIEFWIKHIHTETKLRKLIYRENPEEYKDRAWFSADRVFDEIGEAENMHIYFDEIIDNAKNHTCEELEDLVDKYIKEDNRWIFSYMNYIDKILIRYYIQEHQLEELSSICPIMLNIQECLVGKSNYLANFK